MKYLGSWRWNPTKGEYEIPSNEPLHGSGEVSAVDTFRDKTVLLIGGTGFVGKVLLAMLLDRFPELKHLYVQVRKKRGVTAEQRFATDVLQAPPLRYVTDRHGLDNIRQRISVIEGDVNEELCGISAELTEQLKGKIDVVVNLAGLVEFDPPLPDSLMPNVYGVRHLIDLVRALGAKLVHISTCYVAGKKDGRILEDTPVDGYYPKRTGPDDKRFNLAEELKWCEDLIESCKRERQAGGNRSMRERLRDAGMQRADYWGWINTYTYTKSMGEQLIVQSPGLEYAIVRPAIVESSMRFPFPGWNEGLTTSAPLVLMGGEGLKGWPVRKDRPLEIIPVDLVAMGILVVTAATLCGRNKPVYHLATADENPVMLPRLVAFLGMNSRFRNKHKKDGNKLANFWKAYVETQVITIGKLESRRKLMHRGLDIIHATLTFAKTVSGHKRFETYLKNLRTTRRQIRQQEIMLDKFLPFMIQNSFIFDTRNIRETVAKLTDEDLKRLKWDPETIDWADYWVNIHTKGIERWIGSLFPGPKKNADNSGNSGSRLATS